MTEDQDAKESQSDSGSKTYVNKTKDKKIKPQRPLTKIVIRRLPPSMTEEAFLEQVSPIPEHDFFYFAKPDASLGNNVYSRAYINFVNVDDIYLFRDKFDGYVFLDEKGLEYVGIVEYAPFQRIPKKKKKKDPKCGTIESDPVYQEFVESLTKEQETDNQPKLEYSYPISDGNDKKVQSTPLLEYLAARKQDKRGRDERRRRENDKRKMRIERKSKDVTIKKSGDNSEDEIYECDQHDNKNNLWFGEQRIYHKSRTNSKSSQSKLEPKSSSTPEEIISNDSDWDNHFPALSMKAHNAFTLTSNKCCDKKVHENVNKSGGDTHKEEEGEIEVIKVKSRDWDKESAKDDPDDFENKEETKTYRDRKSANGSDRKKSDKDDELIEDSDKGYKREKKDRKESPREQKIKKYSDTRKERLKQGETVKSDKQSVINKMISSESKRNLNHDDIKPFTQLPQVRTDDLINLMKDMERKAKLEESGKDSNDLEKHQIPVSPISVRRSSFESSEGSVKDEGMRRQASEDRKSMERDGSEEKEKSESSERRAERRIRNKDRPSLVIYQPGMGKFSKQRLAKEKDTVKVNDNEKKDT